MNIFIVNPHSQSGKGQRIWDQIETVLKQRTAEYTVYFTKYQKHATKIVQKITSDLEPHTFIVLGGDGTINEVINGITDFDKVTLGYIPSGSSNDFARAQKLETDPLKALDRILAGTCVARVDIGMLSYHNRTRHFIVSTGIGFDAAVCHEAVISSLKVFFNQIKLGKLTYAGIALDRLIFSSPGKMTLTLDDHAPLQFERSYFATVMNHCYEGGGFKFCPEARPDDQLLDVIVVDNMSKLKVLALLPTAFKGHHVKFKGVHIFTCKKALIETHRALPVHTDGEPVFLQKKIRVTLSDKQVRILK